MRNLPIEIQALLTRRQGITVHRLFLLNARNRQTGAMEQIGIWSGADHQNFVIDGVTKTFYGGGNFLSVGALTTARGLNIRKLTLNMAPFSAEVRTILLQYEPKFSPISVHLAFFDPDTNNLVADPFRVFKGWIDTAPIRQGAQGEDSTAVINAVGHSRILTRVFPARRSNETQRRRNSGDSFFAAVAITGTTVTPWGTMQ